MAFFMVSPGMLASFALAIANLKRGLPSGSPPERDAIVNSRMILVKIFPRLASWAPLCRLIVAQWLCPPMAYSICRCNTYPACPTGKTHHHLKFLDVAQGLEGCQLQGDVEWGGAPILNR